MRRLLALAAALALGAVAVLWLTGPQPIAAADWTVTGDPARGAVTFAAAGCAACHTAPEGDPAVLAGGQAFATAFGTFYAPNISPDPTHGVGAWTDAALASAIMRGVGADGAHLYPAFPYAAYAKATPQDVADIIAHLRTLPADATPSQPHDVGFPFNIRASLGVWKALFVSPDWVLAGTVDETVARGRYLSEALAHCGECHTPRNALGGLDTGAWLAGAPHPSEPTGRIPNITPGALTWSAGEIAEYLKSGFTPEFDTAGGEMAEVVRNTAQLTDADRAAIAAYLKAVPPVTD